MKRLKQILFTLLILTGSTTSQMPTVASGDVMVVSGEANVNGSALVGRRGSVDSQSYANPVTGTTGIVASNGSVSVGPLPFIGSTLPGTAAVGSSSASSTLDFTSLNEIVVDLFSSVSLSSIETDAFGEGSYGVSSQSSLDIRFEVDEDTDYQFDAVAIFNHDSPAWQIRLLGQSAFIFNNATHAGGGTLTSSGVLRPGSYILRAFTSDGVGGTTEPVSETSSINFNFQASRSPIPEPAMPIIVVVTMMGMCLRRRAK